MIQVFLFGFQVKKGLPLLLSAMKAFVTLKREDNEAADDAQENRYDYITLNEDTVYKVIKILKELESVVL